MMKVIEAFVDLTDNNHLYHPGDTFPRKGLEVSTERIAFLSGSDNLIGKPVIVDEPEPVSELPKPKRSKKRNVD